MAGELLSLIRRYLVAVDTAVVQLREAFKCEDLLSAAREGRIPRSGTVGSVAYRFHGVGCEVDLGGWTVDFDFGPAGRHDGFDAWRLWRFAREFPSEFRECQQLEAIKSSLDDLRLNGIVAAPRWPPSEHLYYLV